MTTHLTIAAIKTAFMALIISITASPGLASEGLFQLITFLAGTYIVGTWMVCALDIAEHLMAKQKAEDQDYWFSELEHDITERLNHTASSIKE